MEHRAGETPLKLGQQWRSQTSSKAPLPGHQGGPAGSPQRPLAAPAAQTGAAPTSTQHCCGQHEIPVQRGSQSHTSSAVTDPSRFGVFPSPAWHPQLLHWNLPFGCSQELSFMILLPPLGLGCRLFFPCSFQHKKNSFFPTLLEDKKQVKNSCKFWGVFLLFCKRKRAGSWAFPQILLHEMDVLEKRKSTAGELT